MIAKLLLLFALVSPVAAAAQTDQEAQVLMSEARRFFEQLDYERAVTALDRAIAGFEAKPTPEALKQLPLAYEMRARSRFGLDDQNGAKADFVLLLKVDPAYALTGEVSPRVVTLFEDAKKTTVTQLTLKVSPANAEVQLDGVAVSGNTVMPVAVGDHTLTAKRIGYRAATYTFKANPQEAIEAPLTLERVSAIMTIVTAPSGVEVIVDGISHGRTTPGPPPAEYAEKAARAGVPASELSAVMVIAEVPIGMHRVELKRDCYVRTERRQTVDQFDDYILDPVKLEPAVATLTVKSSQPGTAIYVDGQQRGVAPQTVADLCEGEHFVELRSASGRYFRRIDAVAGQKIDVTGTLKPAFALVSTSGQAALNVDVRQAIERAFEPAQSVTIFAPSADQVAQALKANQLPPEFLAFDASKRPLGVSADIGTTMRRDLSVRLAKTFDAQGIASVTIPSPLNRNRLVVSLLGAGSSEPDVLDINLDSPETIGNAIAQLDRAPSFFRPSIGISVIDVADVQGPVVMAVDAAGSAAKAGIQQGDVLTGVNAQPITDAAGLTALLAGRKLNDDLSLELKDRAGAAKRADVKVFMTPRLIGLNDQTLFVNRILVDLRARLLSQGDPLEDSVMRLNVAAALARVENWSEARLELQRVKLPDGPGVSSGTVQYLLGLCADRLGNRAEAEAAWKIAAQSEGLLTEDGPSVKELAEAKLAELQRRLR
jgi:hypothetical protein